ncbi:MAG: hypothetical protein RIS64_176 [Bacteroidota bacterium]|jgi:hypothetical protein
MAKIRFFTMIRVFETLYFVKSCIAKLDHLIFHWFGDNSKAPFFDWNGVFVAHVVDFRLAMGNLRVLKQA